MSDFLTVDVSVSSISIPTPPVVFDQETVAFPVIGPYGIPDIDYGPFRFNLPNVDIPQIYVPDPSLDPGTTTLYESFSFRFFVPDVDLPELSVEYEFIEIPVVDFGFWILDPFEIELTGGSVGWETIDVDETISINVPDPGLSVDYTSVGGGTVTFQDISIPGLDVDTPNIPRFNLPSVTVPIGASLDGSQPVPDPTTIQASASIDVDGIAAYVLSPLPADFVANPAEWVFWTVLDEVESHITVDVAKRLRDVSEGFLELVLEEETKERLRGRGGNN
jgi:hypothetical protein